MTALAGRTPHPKRAALTGGLLIGPFLAVNEIVGRKIEPFFSIIRPGPQTSMVEYIILFIVIACLPIGALVAARPALKRSTEGKREIHFLNVVVAAFLLITFVFVSFGWGADIYRCEVLRIPNCD